MRRLFVIVIGLFTFMAVSPVLVQVAAGNDTISSWNATSTTGHKPVRTDSGTKFGPRILARHCAANQTQSAYCVQKGACVEIANTAPAVTPNTLVYQIVRHQGQHALAAMDGPLRPPRSAWKTTMSRTPSTRNSNGVLDI